MEQKKSVFVQYFIYGTLFGALAVFLAWYLM